MPFGDTAKKLQKVTSMAEDLYEKTNELLAQLKQVRDRVDQTTEQIERMERDLEKQRLLVEALAKQQGLDVEKILEEHADRIDEDATGDGERDEAATGGE